MPKEAVQQTKEQSVAMTSMKTTLSLDLRSVRFLAVPVHPKMYLISSTEKGRKKLQCVP